LTSARTFRDGPLSYRRPEEIAFGTGKSALGPVLVAAGEKGIVSIIIREKAGRLVRDLRARFPKANLTRKEKDCKLMVARVTAFIAAPIGRLDLPLDVRGTPFQQRVWQEVRKIPLGQASTYTKIAESIGAPRAIRAVASSCSNNWFAFAIPCHRVLHKGSAGSGSSGRRDGRQYAWVDYESKLVARRWK
jgi:AraC family transcriptional regulator of adaptative response/methylated-DNA-[protein]-cysteine methyltransferase